jgi:protein-disulfide isomerase
MENSPQIKTTIVVEENQKKTNLYLIITGIVVALIVLGLLTNGFGLLTGLTISGPDALSIGNSPVLGNSDAKVTIFVFTDFSCPFCAGANGDNEQIIAFLKSKNLDWQAPIPNIIKDYVDSGKAKLVFKYYPGHGAGKPAQIVALALQEQGLFWKFHDLAFANQADVGNLVKMKALAQQLGANMTKLESDLTNNNYQAQLNADISMGKTAGVSGTPSFFINNQKISGAQSYSEFKKVLDSELAK